jgi:tetratricopeptide (TPR) repeat protein
LREIEAQILGQSEDNHVVQAAADRFVEVASEWEFQQEHLRAAKALRGLCVGPLWHLGHYSEAQERLDRAARLAINQTFDFGVTMTTKALFDARCGDWESFQRSLDQARMIVAESGIRWLESYLALGSAYKAAADRSPSAVRAAVRSARDLLGPLFETDTGVLFTAESAVLLAEGGDHEEARRMLDSVAHRCEQNAMEYRFADLVLLARAGDREGAWLAWRVLDREDLIPNDRRWRIELELARADDLAGAPQTIDAESVARLAERLGLARVARQLAPELMGGAQHVLPIRVEILGGFRVHGSDGDVPKGHARELIKILAVEGGSAPVETVVAHLWPDVEFKLGLRRLKNVVVKVRDLLGPEAICREASVLRFGDHVTVDVNDFETMRLASMAKRSLDPVGSRDAAIVAIDVYEGPLLVDDLFVDRINERRFQLEQSAAELLEYVDREHRPNAAWFAAASRRVNAG